MVKPKSCSIAAPRLVTGKWWRWQTSGGGGRDAAVVVDKRRGGGRKAEEVADRWQRLLTSGYEKKTLMTEDVLRRQRSGVSGRKATVVVDKRRR